MPPGYDPGVVPADVFNAWDCGWEKREEKPRFYTPLRER